MNDYKLKDLYESTLGVRLLPHQLQSLKQLRQEEAKNKKDEVDVHESAEKHNPTKMCIIHLYFAGIKEQSRS